MLFLTLCLGSALCIIDTVEADSRNPAEISKNSEEEDAYAIDFIPKQILKILEYSMFIWFSLEFFLRLLTTPSRTRFFKTPLNYIDFVAILPGYLFLIINFSNGKGFDIRFSPFGLSSGEHSGSNTNAMRDEESIEYSSTVSQFQNLSMNSSSDLNPFQSSSMQSELKLQIASQQQKTENDTKLFLLGQSMNNLRILRALQILRALRALRVLKLARHSSGLKAFGQTLNRSKHELLLLFLFIFVNVIIFSSLVYFMEIDEPDTKFTSIPITCWWAVVTITTVGYGDMAPTSTWGRIFAGWCSIMGVLVIALPVSVIASNFSDFYKREKRMKKINQMSSFHGQSVFRTGDDGQWSRGNTDDEDEDQKQKDHLQAYKRMSVRVKKSNSRDTSSDI